MHHLPCQQSVQLVCQRLRVSLAAAAALNQYAGDPVGEKVQGHGQIPVA